MTTNKFNFPAIEKKILQIWESEMCFKVQNELIRGKPKYIFYDGPPFATGLPHYGHILSGTIKDTVTRFFIQQGFSCDRRFGWDCHGLPVEYEIDKIHNISTRDEVFQMGINKYNDLCRSIVLKYTEQWEEIVKRMARWADFKNGYRTMDITFMESIWYTFAEIYKMKRVYRGFRVMSFSTACSTPLSNFEANLNYKEVTDPSVIVAFPLLKPIYGKPNLLNKKINLLIWTTTPWTLPSNLGASVNPDFEYCIIKLNEEYYVILENRLTEYKIFKDAKIIDKIYGIELIGKQYEPPFNIFANQFPHLFKVLKNKNVDPNSGTGIVPNSPAFGEEDYNIFLNEGLLKENEELPCLIDDNGIFTETEFKGMYFKDSDKHVIKVLGKKLLWRGDIFHRYPFCWRSDTPLIYKLVPNWFIKLSDLQEKLKDLNESIFWVPHAVKTRFGNWLQSARDWSISRNRFWGTPLPIWTNSDYTKKVCISSISELEQKGFRIKNGKREKVQITDLHREHIDDIFIEDNGEVLKRVDEVFDCWFESGSMPLAQDHWPFSNTKKKENLNDEDEKIEIRNKMLSLHVSEPSPANFIAEGLDQTRGWFYTLHVVSTLLFDRPAFKNIIVNGIVLASDGKKMSKRLKNYPDPMSVADKFGFDSLRLYLISSPVVEGENLRFKEKGVEEVFKNLMINWLNCINFYKETFKTQDKAIKINLNVFETWIMNEINELKQKIKFKMHKYELSGILSLSLNFVENLSNWYIRMNREILRKNNNILKFVITQFSVLMAPFAPFFAEYSYQTMIGNSELDSNQFDSVHYQMYPEIQEIVNCNFDRTKKIIEAIRSMRELSKLSLKTPLHDCIVISENDDFDKEIIQNECNILNVNIDKNVNKYAFDVHIKPNFVIIKKMNNQGDISAKIALIQKMTSKNDLTCEKFKSISIKELIFEKRLVFEAKDRQAKNFGDFSVILNTQLTEELLEMKIVREFFAFIQRFRKEKGLKIDDNVKIKIDNDKLKTLIMKDRKYKIEFLENDEERVEKSGKRLFPFLNTQVSVEIFKFTQ